jgi:hypothetical protein
VRPATYRAGGRTYAILSIPALVAVLSLSDLQAGSSTTNRLTIELVAGSLIWMVLMVCVCRTIRLEITTDAIAYSTLWRKVRRIRFSDIGSAVMIDYHDESPGRSPRRDLRAWNLILTPKPHVGGGPMKIPLTWINRNAYEEICRILAPARWTPG